jgi:hypothetical protein
MVYQANKRSHLKHAMPLLVVFSMLTGCTSSQLSSRVIESDIIYTLTIPGYSYTTQDTLTGTFEVSNFATQKRRFDFPDQQQCGFFLIRDSRDTVFQDPDIISPAQSDFTLSGGERKTFSFRCIFKKSYRTILPGQYTLRASLLTFHKTPHVDVQLEIK